MDGLEPLLSDKVLPVMVETEVSRLVPKPGGKGGGSFSFRFVKQLWDSVDLSLVLDHAFKNASAACII